MILSNFPTIFPEKVINSAKKKLLIRYEPTAYKNLLFRKILKYNLCVSFGPKVFNKRPTGGF